MTSSHVASPHIVPSEDPGTPLLLEVKGVSKRFPVRTGPFTKQYVSAVDGLTFSVKRGTTVGIVGESGCGKSTAARLILGLLDLDEGSVVFEGSRVGGMGNEAQTRRDPRRIRRNMQMVFQDPHSALNPRASIGEIIAFPMKVHRFPKQEREERTRWLLEQVGLHGNHASYYPHQMSGGQRQRVNIARALALSPKLVVCDEAVSALDKSVQAQVLNLLKDLQQELSLTYVFISHDLNVVQYMSDEVLVMYLGQAAEMTSSENLYANPLHPYTRALLASIPRLEEDGAAPPATPPLEGELPSPLDPPSGCRFRTRCPMAMEVCSQVRPEMVEAAPGHRVACHLYSTGSEQSPTSELPVISTQPALAPSEGGS